MNRTGEIVLSIIGALIYGLLAALGGITVWFFNNKTMWQGFSDELKIQEQGLNTNEVMSVLGNGGWILTIVSIVGLLLGIIAIILVKGDKKPKAAGIILIVTAIVGSIFTFGVGLISGLFYLIAGIMCLARREEPKIAVE